MERAEDGPVGPHTIVWMVSLKTGLAGRRGHLWLEPRVLVFRPVSNRFGDTRIRLEHIRRVKAARFTPVLDLRVAAPDVPPRMGFYFVEPPSLEPTTAEADPGSRATISNLLPLTSPKRRARREAATSLREWNPLVREELAEWVTRIRKAMKD